MKTLIILAIMLISSTVYESEFDDPVGKFMASQPDIRIDMTGIWDGQKSNNQLKRKNWEPKER